MLVKILNGAELDGASVSLEPDNHFELSAAQLDTLHKTCAEVANHLYQVRRFSTALDVKEPSSHMLVHSGCHRQLDVILDPIGHSRWIPGYLHWVQTFI